MKKTLDLLLINPPYERLKGFSLGSLPNGILGLATYIKRSGFNALVYDADTNFDGILRYDNENRAQSQNQYAESIDDDSHYVWSEIRDTIKRLNPQFVGISLMTPTLHSGLKVADISKKLGKIVLVGGPHIAIVKNKILSSDLVDFAFFGEGECSLEAFLKLYPDMEKLESIKGLGFTKDGRTVYNGFSQRITDLDALPFPDRELLVFKERYFKVSSASLASIMASRGCPYKCAFCASVPIWGRKTVFRSPSHVIEEIKHLHSNYGIKEFRFFDDTFTAKKANMVEFCKQLIDAFGERYFSWWCLSRVNAIDDNVLYWLKKSGCDQIHLGVESGSERILKLIHKGIKLMQVEDAVNLARRYKFWVHTFFMIGLPYERVEDMRQTISFMKKIKPDSINLCTFTPYPGTELYDYCVRKKLLIHDDSYELFKYIGHHSTTNYFLKHVSKDDYMKKLSESLDVSAAITNSLTWNKIKYRIKNLTIEKIMRQLKLQCKRKFTRHKRR